MATKPDVKPLAVKPPKPQTKPGKVDELLAKMPAGPKKPSKARATAVLAALELTRERGGEALKRRGLKLG